MSEDNRVSLENCKIELQRIRDKSNIEKDLISTLLKKEYKVGQNIYIKKGLKEVTKGLSKQNLNDIALLIVSTSLKTPYLLDDILTKAVERNVPIYFTPSNFFVASVLDKKFSTSCALVLSLKKYDLFNDYQVNLDAIYKV
jgi:ribosomal protein L7Ae-like RNA K-turn-binding protein